MCVCLCVFVSVKSPQLCPMLCNPMDYSLPGSSVHGVLQARILGWVAIFSSRGSSWPWARTQICISCIGRQNLDCCAICEACSWDIALGYKIKIGRKYSKCSDSCWAFLSFSLTSVLLLWLISLSHSLGFSRELWDEGAGVGWAWTSTLWITGWICHPPLRTLDLLFFVCLAFVFFFLTPWTLTILSPETLFWGKEHCYGSGTGLVVVSTWHLIRF